MYWILPFAENNYYINNLRKLLTFRPRYFQFGTVTNFLYTLQAPHFHITRCARSIPLDPEPNICCPTPDSVNKYMIDSEIHNESRGTHYLHIFRDLARGKEGEREQKYKGLGGTNCYTHSFLFGRKYLLLGPLPAEHKNSGIIPSVMHFS